MVRALGVDPGTGSMDLLAFDDRTGEILYERSFPRVSITKNPKIIIDIIKKLYREYKFDAIVAPSGYGIPLKRAREASESEIRQATFITCEDEARGLQIVGLRKIMIELRDSDIPVWFTPGGIHLPTIPGYRKTNRIDMGTADKIFTVAASMAKESIYNDKINIIVVEAGLAYTSTILVEDGKITDAIAGTAGFWGFLGGGSMDAEYAYILAAVKPRFSKSLLFQGGAASVFGIKSLEEVREDEKGLKVSRMISEGILKSISALIGSASEAPNAIYLSGRLVRHPVIGRVVRSMISQSRVTRGIPIRYPLRLGRETKEGATGAALIANGIAGGKYEWIVRSLRLREAGGSIFQGIIDDAIKRIAMEEFSKDCAV